MTDIIYKEYILTADEFVLFADKMGETDGMTKEQAEKSLAHHRCCIAALMCDELIGIGRLIGDAAIYWCLVDIWVLPEYQGKGIGKNIVNGLVEYAKNNSIPGTSISVFLMAAHEKEEFYEKCGFLRRPHGWEGAGMEMEIDL
jgi:GNAT superfamily N-acetyltransferase